jgi:prephenate dehydrogenase
MTELQEHIFAHELLDTAKRMALITNDLHDRQAATVAILVHALMLATPGLSQEGRQRLFLKEEK